MPPVGKRPGVKDVDSSAEFDKYFSQQFGVPRWRVIAKALQKETTHVALLNQFATRDSSVLEGMKPCLSVGGIQCFRLPKSAASSSGRQPDLDSHSCLMTHYWIDLASVYPVLLLGAGPGMTVLDAAAAPGGKSLILAHQMFGPLVRSSGAAVGSVQACPQQLEKQEQQQQRQDVQLQQQQQQHPSMQHGTGMQGQSSFSEHASNVGEDRSGAVPAVDPREKQPSMAPVQAENGLHGSKQQSDGFSGSQTQAASRGGLLIINEPDVTRRTRLQRVLAEYLPHALVAGTSGASAGKRVGMVGALRVFGHEAEKYWSRRESERYDRVLLDAPCSNDRHIVQQSCARRGMVPSRDWSLLICRQLAALQLQLLLAGFRALAVGGRLVYSTCSLASMENDGVVNKALERCPNMRVVSPKEDDYMPASVTNQRSALQEIFSPEPTKHGILLLPDLCGHGPIYVCVLEKKEDQASAARVHHPESQEEESQEEEE